MTEFKSPHIGLPLLAPGQALKYTTVNESLLSLDRLVQLSVIAQVNTPPAGVEEHDICLVGNFPQEDFSDQSGNLAVRQGGQWTFITPKAGWRVYNLAQDETLVFDGLVWKSQLSTRFFGINAQADETNRLSVNSDSVLLNHNGQSSRVSVNKAHETDTASVIYQTAFSGRAEIGLSGTDSLQIKVSPDGVQWTEALSVDPQTGMISCNQGLSIGGDLVTTQKDVTGQICFKGEVGDLADLDNFTETGVYHQTSNILALNGVNYPIKKAGLLSVVSNGSMVFQTYHVWSGAGIASNGFHLRGAYNGTWGSWREI